MDHLLAFAQLARHPCPAHADLAFALAAEFRRPRLDADAALDDLARAVRPSAADRPGDQLACCAEVLTGRLRCTALRWAGINDLLLDRVIVGGAGHPLALAVVCVEVARRAGIELGVVAGGAGCFVAHPRRPDSLLLDVARGRLLEPGGRACDVGWQCPHQVAARMLNRIGERADRTGNIAWALRAAELRLALPFARPVRDELVHALAHVRARMN